MNVGRITVEGVSDGSLEAPATLMFNKPNAEDWAPHQEFLDANGNLTFEMGGFLMRDRERTVLIDVGIGPHADPARTGSFMNSLALLGVQPSDVTDVVLTHLHSDHIGWASDGEKPLFPEAIYRCHQADWDFFAGPDPHDDSLAVQLMGGQRAIEILPAVAPRVETWDGDGPVLPGLDARVAPGHTPGSTVLVISSGENRALLLGDVAHCPAELLEDDWEMIGDIDRALAQKTRVALAREFEGTDVPMGATHFPGLRFGRLLPGTGLRRWVFD